MLPESFLDWWFAPWSYASPVRPDLRSPADPLARNDAYPLWCAQAGVQPRFPNEFDPGWHVAAITTADELNTAARLFGGLIAARQHDQVLLGQLPMAERRWCMSIAITQPLKACQSAPFSSEDSIQVRGLVELARRLERWFPGMWTRLRLLLPETAGERVASLLPAALAETAADTGNPLRAQRCWQLCRTRAETVLQAAAAPVQQAEQEEYAEAEAA